MYWLYIFFPCNRLYSNQLHLPMPGWCGVVHRDEAFVLATVSEVSKNPHGEASALRIGHWNRGLTGWPLVNHLNRLLCHVKPFCLCLSKFNLMVMYVSSLPKQTFVWRVKSYKENISSFLPTHFIVKGVEHLRFYLSMRKGHCRKL